MSLERFIDTGEVEITRDPISNMRRVAVLQNNQWWNPVLKQAELSYMVHYLDEQGNKVGASRLQPYRWNLLADTNTKIDAQFNVIPHPGRAPAPVFDKDKNVTNQSEIDAYNALLATWTNAISEYDYMLNAVKNGANFFELQYNMTLLRANQGKADK